MNDEPIAVLDYICPLCGSNASEIIVEYCRAHRRCLSCGFHYPLGSKACVRMYQEET